LPQIVAALRRRVVAPCNRNHHKEIEERGGSKSNCTARAHVDENDDDATNDASAPSCEVATDVLHDVLSPGTNATPQKIHARAYVIFYGAVRVAINP